VGCSWLTDLVLPPDPLQLNLGAGRGMSQAHFEPGDAVCHQGDLGDRLYMVLAGEAEVVRRENGEDTILAQLGPGEYFGEAALLRRSPRGATVCALTPMDVLTPPRGDFQALLGSLPELRRASKMSRHAGRHRTPSDWAADERTRRRARRTVEARR